MFGHFYLYWWQIEYLPFLVILPALAHLPAMPGSGDSVVPDAFEYDSDAPQLGAQLPGCPG